MQQGMGISLGNISLEKNESPLLSNHELAPIDSQIGSGLPDQFSLHALRFFFFGLTSCHSCAWSHSHFQFIATTALMGLETRVCQLSWAAPDAYTLLRPTPLLGWHLGSKWCDTDVIFRAEFLKSFIVHTLSSLALF